MIDPTSLKPTRVFPSRVTYLIHIPLLLLDILIISAAGVIISIAPYPRNEVSAVLDLLPLGAITLGVVSSSRIQ